MSFLKALIETAKLPVDVVADVVTFGGLVNDRPEPHTVSRVRRAYRELDEAGRQP